MHEQTFMFALKRSALLSATDSNHTDNVVLQGVVVCYQHLGVRFGYDDLPLLPTCEKKKKKKRGKGLNQQCILLVLFLVAIFLVVWKKHILYPNQHDFNLSKKLSNILLSDGKPNVQGQHIILQSIISPISSQKALK